MAESIQAMRERRNALAKEARNLHENTPAASWGEKETAQYNEIMDRIGREEDAIKREEQVLALDAARQTREMGVAEQDAAPNLFNKWLRGGDNALNAQEWQSVRNTMSVGTGSQGGYTVQTSVATELIRAMKAFGGMRSVASSLSTSQGNPLNYPSCDDTSNTGEQVAENAAASSQDVAFGTVGLNVFKYSSKVITVPFELLQDSQVDVEALVLSCAAERLARIQNTKFTTGAGTTEPNGIVTAAGSGKVGVAGQTLTVIYDDLVDLIHSIDPAYRAQGGLGFMMNDASVKVLRKIKDGQSRPIFVPGYEVGVPGGAPDTLLGYPITVNQDVAVMAANAKSILFGRLSNYMIRDVMEATMFRFTDSAYTKNGQVGFLAWQRAGGNLLDVSGATVKYYANSAT